MAQHRRVARKHPAGEHERDVSLGARACRAEGHGETACCTSLPIARDGAMPLFWPAQPLTHKMPLVVRRVVEPTELLITQLLVKTA